MPGEGKNSAVKELPAFFGNLQAALFCAIIANWYKGECGVWLRFIVPQRCNGWQLRDVLRRLEISTQLSRAVKQGAGFFLDGAPVHTNAVCRAGQSLSFCLPEEPPTSVSAEPLPLTLAYEDEHAAVLVKPAGMAVHPTKGYPNGTLANAWLGLLQSRGQAGVFRPVTRLDRNTSGLVLAAKNAYAAPLLAKTVQKEYLAVCEGTPAKASGVIDAPIGLAAGSTVVRQVTPGGRPSRTGYAVLASGGGLSLVKARLFTGRTHQIRVHFAFLGCPLAGDGLYGGSNARIARQALHCARLRFAAPADGRQHTVKTLLPPDMAAVCQAIPGAEAALAGFFAADMPEPRSLP